MSSYSTFSWDSQDSLQCRHTAPLVGFSGFFAMSSYSTFSWILRILGNVVIQYLLLDYQDSWQCRRTSWQWYGRQALHGRSQSGRHGTRQPETVTSFNCDVIQPWRHSTVTSFTMSSFNRDVIHNDVIQPWRHSNKWRYTPVSSAWNSDVIHDDVIQPWRQSQKWLHTPVTTCTRKSTTRDLNWCCHARNFSCSKKQNTVSVSAESGAKISRKHTGLRRCFSTGKN